MPVPRTLTDGDLILRLPGEADVARIVAVCQDPDIQRHTRVPTPYRADHARALIELADDGHAEGTGIHRVLVSTDAPERVLGCVGVQTDPERVGEVGYWLATEARGRGLATRAARVVCRSAFDELELPVLILRASRTNPSSVALARRLGFRHVGTIRAAHHDGPSGGPAPRTDAEVFDLRPGELR